MNSFAQKSEDIIAHRLGNLVNRNRAGHGHRLFVSIQKIDAIGANAKVPLKVSFGGRSELIVQIIKHQIGHLLAGLVG